MMPNRQLSGGSAVSSFSKDIESSDMMLLSGMVPSEMVSLSDMVPLSGKVCSSDMTDLWSKGIRVGDRESMSGVGRVGSNNNGGSVHLYL